MEHPFWVVSKIQLITNEEDANTEGVMYFLVDEIRPAPPSPEPPEQPTENPSDPKDSGNSGNQ